jgi:V8-like Glu-specific endopeptidase
MTTSDLMIRSRTRGGAPAAPYRLDRITDEADYAIVGPRDDRSRVLRTRTFPYSAICHIERDFGDGRLSGCSAFLIGPTTLLTAAHCIASPLRLKLGVPGLAKRIRVRPGRDSKDGAPYGSQWAKSWRVHPDYLRTPRPLNDIGVIELARPFAGDPGYFPLISPSDAALEQIRRTRLLHIAGYPGDKPIGTQWEHAERLDKIGPDRLEYSVDTCPGHSGSPVWIIPDPGMTPVVIAVHTAGPKPSSEGPWGCRPGAPLAPAGLFNSGRRLSRAVRSRLEIA